MTPSRQRDVRHLASRISRGGHVGAHHHAHHQLLRVDAGALSFTHRSASWVIPNGGAVWLPARLDHRLEALEDANVATLYVRPRSRRTVPAPGPVEMSTLLHELMRTLAHRIDDPARRRRLELVVHDEIALLRPRSFVVALPIDAAARAVALAVVGSPGDIRSLAELASAAGTSPRTVQRRFRAETGLPFQTWRRRAGLQHAMACLERGQNISEVAHRCGFSSASAFIAAFRSELGITPGVWRDLHVRRQPAEATRDGGARRRAAPPCLVQRDVSTPRPP
ncbi:MAG: AraC family transcriptional regulator [Ilumatobacteraceae bacterium]|nr:AraC family transcriptional regulator [Ilumatobacteraceae bacterium]